MVLDFYQFQLWEGMVVLKCLFLLWVGCGGIESTD